MNPPPLLFMLGALMSCAAFGVSSRSPCADTFRLQPEGYASARTIPEAPSGASILSRTVAECRVGRDADSLLGIDLQCPKTLGSQWPVRADDGVRSGFRKAAYILAQTGSAVPLPVPTVQAQGKTNEAFDCYAVESRSHDYEVGNYAQAFKEMEALASEQCPKAEHLLAVMYAKGQGVKRDLVHTYAWLLLALSEGVTRFGGSGAGAPLLSDDSEEFEIVRFGAQLTDEQLAEAERLASSMVSPHAIAENGAIGPTGIADAIKELRSRRERYKLNGKLAALELPVIASPLLRGMTLSGGGRILAQLVRGPDSEAAPHELLFLETRMKDIANGHAGANQELKREIDIASAQGVTFAWLKRGEAVRIVRFGVNAGSASQIELSDGRVAIRRTKNTGSTTAFWK